MFIYTVKYKMVQEKIAYKVICSLSLPLENFFLRCWWKAQWNNKSSYQPGCIEKNKPFLQRKKLILSHTNKVSYFHFITYSLPFSKLLWIWKLFWTLTGKLMCKFLRVVWQCIDYRCRIWEALLVWPFGYLMCEQPLQLSVCWYFCHVINAMTLNKRG